MRNRLRVDMLGALLVAALVSWIAPHGGPEPPLIDAAKRGDVETLKALIAKGADVNEVYGDGMTALHWAASQSELDVARLLIQAGANVHAGTRIGNYTPLHLASRAGSVPVVEALLTAGSDPNAVTTNSGATALHFAAENGNAGVIRALVKSGADVNAKEAEWGQTPLMLAAGYDRVDAVKALLDLGANAAATTKVVDVAARAKQTQAVTRRFWELMARFMDDKGGVRGEAWPPSPGQLQAAIEAARQAQANSTKPEDTKAAAELKAIVDDAQRDMGRQVSIPQAELVGHMGGMTALLHAVRAGHTNAALELLARGADINQASGDGSTPLLIATLNGQFDLAAILLQKGANPNLASEAGATPLYEVLNVQWAGKTRHTQPRVYEQQSTTYLDLMDALLKAGANPNARLTKDLWYTFNVYVSTDLNGTTPFWRAALGLDVDAMKMLIAYGADPNIPSIKPGGDDAGRRGGGVPGSAGKDGEVDPSGLPPVPNGGPGVYAIHAATGLMYGETYAANEHRFVPDAWMDAVKYLVSVGADVNARDFKGNTPLHNAASRGDNDMIRFLIEQGADVRAVTRKGQTTADMANGPHDRVQPFPSTIALLESLGSKNNHHCVGC